MRQSEVSLISIESSIPVIRMNTVNYLRTCIYIYIGSKKKPDESDDVIGKLLYM